MKGRESMRRMECVRTEEEGKESMRRKGDD